VRTRKTVRMPAVQIDVLDVWSEAERSAIAEAVQRALVATLGVPERDRFQVVRAHASCVVLVENQREDWSLGTARPPI
jgi:hypothetical protein